MSGGASPAFAGRGEMRDRCRTLDWRVTPVGAVETWPPAHRITAETVLASGLPAIALLGPELVQLYNDEYIPFLAVRHPAALGMSARVCWPEVWPVLAPILESVSAGETVTLTDQPYRLLRGGPHRPADHVFITLCYVPVRDETGGVSAILVTGVDTTAQVTARAIDVDRRRLEAKLHGVLLETSLLLDQVSDAYFLLDGELRVAAVNESAERAMKLSRAQLLGRTFVELFPTEAGAELEQRCGQVATDRVETHFIHRYLDGLDARHVDIDAYPAQHGGVAVLWRDITARVRAETERTRLLASAEASNAESVHARDVAEGANRAKGEFLATMSHELRTPLNAIAGYTELLSLGIYGAVTAEQMGALARIEHSQRHLLGLINGVLNYARVDAGAVSYALTDVQLDEVLATCEALTAPQAQAKGLSMRRAATDGAGAAIPVAARADADKLRQVLLNLLSNAIKFTKPGGTITLGCAARSDGLVAVQVTDTGDGIAADQLERVFQPFVQVDASLTRTQDGTGLGLAISRELTRGMGGDLTVESSPGMGSTFTLTLPASRQPAHPSA